MLGPKLFILYVNDICNVSNLVKCILLADDTSLFCSDANVNRLFERVSSVLASMCRWFATNKLSLNVLKTSYMSNCYSATLLRLILSYISMVYV